METLIKPSRVIHKATKETDLHSLSKPKKLLIIGERFFPEEFLINDVVAALHGQDFEVTILTQQPSYPHGQIFEGYRNKLLSVDNFNGAKIIRTGVVQGYHRSVVRKLFNYLAFIILGIYAVCFKISKPDSILIYQTGPLSQAIIGIVSKWRFRKPLIIWTWDIWPDSIYAYGFKKTKLLSWLLDKFVGWVYRSCDKILISSPGFVEVLSKYVPNHKFELLPNWIADTQVSNNKIQMPEGFNFTFTGNIGKVQNLENIINGFKIAVKKDNSLYLNLVGNGSFMEDLKTIVATEHIPNVKFWGQRPLSEMPNFYAESQVLVISLNSGSVWDLYIPSKFQSYLNAKKPILAVMGGTVPKLVNEYQLGKSVEPHNVEAIAGAFLEMRNSYPALLEHSNANAVFLLNKFFNRKNNLAKLAKFCQ